LPVAVQWPATRSRNHVTAAERPRQWRHPRQSRHSRRPPPRAGNGTARTATRDRATANTRARCEPGDPGREDLHRIQPAPSGSQPGRNSRADAALPASNAATAPSSHSRTRAVEISGRRRPTDFERWARELRTDNSRWLPRTRVCSATIRSDSARILTHRTGCEQD
jgi:hypothetical protein